MPHLVSVYTARNSSALSFYAKDVDLESIIEKAIRKGTYRDKVTRFRQTGNTADKLQLPGFCASGCYSPNHRADNFKSHNGLFSIDIDGLPSLAEAEALRTKASDMKYCVAAFVSPSGRGVKLFVEVELPEDNTDSCLLGWHRAMWPAVSAFVCKQLGVDADHNDTKNCNPNRMCFIGADEGAFYNDDPVPLQAEELPFPDIPKPAAASAPSADVPVTERRRTRFDASEQFSWAVATLEKQGYSFTQGHRHDFTLRLSSILNNQGAKLEDVQALIRQHFAAASSDIEHHTRVAANVYRDNAAQHAQYVPIKPKAALPQPSGAFALAEPIPPDHSAAGTQNNTPPPDSKDIPRWLTKALARNERGDAELVAEEFKGRIIYDHTRGIWMRYEAPIWVADETDQVPDMIEEWITELYEPYKSVIWEVYEATDDDQYKKLYGKLNDRIAALHGEKRIKNITAKVGRILSTTTQAFDANPLRYAFESTVYDLETNTPIPASPDHLLTKKAEFAYNPSAQCPRWQAFLDRVLPDRDVQTFVQRFVGTCLTGDVLAQGLFFAFGHGANGKSTFFSAVELLLGQYQVQIQTEQLLGKSGQFLPSSQEYYKTFLRGARLAVGTEVPTTFQFDEAMIKNITGNDPISAREPYGKPFTFLPTHKLALYGNHKPMIKGGDEGIWRRIWLVPFTERIPDSEQRSSKEMMAEFREELAGIWNWAYEGLLAVRRDGWQVPEAIMAATNEYREESDVLGEFISETMRPLTSARPTLKDIRMAYNRWCISNGQKPQFQTAQRFNAALRERAEKFGYTIDVYRGKQQCVFGYELLEDHRWGEPYEEPASPDPKTTSSTATVVQVSKQSTATSSQQAAPPPANAPPRLIPIEQAEEQRKEEQARFWNDFEADARKPKEPPPF